MASFGQQSGARVMLHPNGVKARPWDTQRISRIGGHVPGAKVKRPSPLDEVGCVKVGELPGSVHQGRLRSPRQPGDHGEWETHNPWARSSAAVGNHSDALGFVDLQQERRNAREKAIESDPKFAPRPKPPPARPPPPPLVDAPDAAADAAAREVRRRAARQLKAELTEPPQRAGGAAQPRTNKGLRAEELARMRARVDTGGAPGMGIPAGMDKDFAKPGDWHTPAGLSDKERLAQAVAELRRRQPELTELEAVQKIGTVMDRALNAPNAAAANHFRAVNTRPPAMR